METLTIPNLPDGTKRKLAMAAKKFGYTKSDGKPNVSQFIRSAIRDILEAK